MSVSKEENKVNKHLPWRLTPSSPLTVSMMFIIMSMMYSMVIYYSKSMSYDFSMMSAQLLKYKTDLVLLSAIGIFVAIVPLMSKYNHPWMDFILWGACFVLALPLTVLSISGLRINWDAFPYSTLMIVIPLVGAIQFLLWETLKDVRYNLIHKDDTKKEEPEDQLNTLLK